MKIFILTIFLTLHLFASSAYISATDLKNELDSPNNNVILLDVTDIDEYNKAHIPNAIRVNINQFRKNVLLHKVIRSPHEIEKLARTLGINNDSKLVIYTHNKKKEILKASYIALAFITHGLNNVSILDGGFSEWIYEYQDLISSKKPFIKYGNFKSSFIRNIIVDKKYLQNKIKKVTFLDSRPPRYYFGTLLSGGVERYGHIPYAVSSFWGDKFTNDKMIKDMQTLQRMFIKANDISKDDEVILYCTGGLETAANWYILYHHLGFKNAKIYDAGLREWGNKDDTPLVRYRWESPSIK